MNEIIETKKIVLYNENSNMRYVLTLNENGSLVQKFEETVIRETHVSTISPEN